MTGSHFHWQYPTRVDVPWLELFEPELLQGWIPPTNQPYLVAPWPTFYDVPFTVRPPGLFIEKDLDWLRDTERPIFVPPMPVVYDLPTVIAPELYVTVDLDWIPESNHPPRGPQFPTVAYQPMPIDPGGFTGLFQDIDWLVETNRPVFPRKTPIYAPAERHVIEQELFLPFVQDWLRETSRPIFMPPQPTRFDVPFVVDDDIAIVKAIDWYRLIEQPLFDAGRRTLYEVPFVVEPTAVTEQNLDWLQQTNVPIFRAGIPIHIWVPGQFEPADYPSAVDLDIDWLVETNQPPDAAARNHALYGVDATNEAIWVGAVTWTIPDREPGDTFLYTAMNWRRVEFWFEVKFRALAGKAYARVLDLTTGAPVPFSVLSTTSSTYVRVRTATTITLTDGDEYITQVGAILTGGGVGDIRAAKLIGVET